MAAADLTAARLRELLHYDQLTGVFTWRVTRGCARAGDIAGHTNIDGYVDIGVGGHLYLAHRLAWLYMNGEWPAALIDHENMVRCDNRWDNLRPATQSQNKQNIRYARADNKCGFLGVSKCRNRWRSVIEVNGKQKHIGCFDTPEQANAAHLEVKRRVHAFCTI